MTDWHQIKSDSNNTRRSALCIQRRSPNLFKLNFQLQRLRLTFPGRQERAMSVFSRGNTLGFVVVFNSQPLFYLFRTGVVNLSVATLKSPWRPAILAAQPQLAKTACSNKHLVSAAPMRTPRSDSSWCSFFWASSTQGSVLTWILPHPSRKWRLSRKQQLISSDLMFPMRWKAMSLRPKQRQRLQKPKTSLFPLTSRWRCWSFLIWSLSASQDRCKCLICFELKEFAKNGWWLHANFYRLFMASFKVGQTVPSDLQIFFDLLLLHLQFQVLGLLRGNLQLQVLVLLLCTQQAVSK